MGTVAQAVDARVKLQPIVSINTAAKLRIHAATTGKSQGEIIDELVESLPSIVVSETAAQESAA